MATIDDRTPLGIKKPHPDNDPYGVDVQRVRDALDLVDTLITGLQSAKADLVGGKLVESQLPPMAEFARLASPALSGNPTAPTQTAGNNTTRLATTAFVATALADLVASSPAALDTLNELAAALGNDANFAATVNGALASLGNRAALLEDARSPFTYAYAFR